MSDIGEKKDHEVDSDDGIINRSPGAVRSKTEGGGASIVQVELGLGKSALAVLWISALVSGLAVAGLIAAMMFIRANIGYTAVLEYDLMDLRAKVGEAHENTPEIDE
jgi:hypothetical protein